MTPRLIEMSTCERKGIAFYERNWLRRARTQFERLLQWDADSLTAHYYLCPIQSRLSDSTQGIFHGKKTLRLSSDEPGACVNLGLAYEFSNKPDLAIIYYKRELDRDPGCPEAHFNLGLLYFGRHRWKQAVPNLSEYIESGCSFRLDDIVYALGSCFDKLDDPNSYIKLYRTYLEKHPGAEWAKANLDAVLFWMSKYRGKLSGEADSHNSASLRG